LGFLVLGLVSKLTTKVVSLETKPKPIGVKLLLKQKQVPKLRATPTKANPK